MESLVFECMLVQFDGEGRARVVNVSWIDGEVVLSEGGE